jgi:hypothetical protein
LSAVSTSLSTSAAAPSETGEQSVRLSGPATRGFFSLSSRQKAYPKSLRSCAYGLPTPFLWFLAAMRASASDWSPQRWN